MAVPNLLTKIQHNKAHLVSDGLDGQDHRLAQTLMTTAITDGNHRQLLYILSQEHTADRLGVLSGRDQEKMLQRFRDKVPVEYSVDFPTIELARGNKHGSCPQRGDIYSISTA